MTLSKIEWTDRSDWNPVRGCTRVSPGCGGPGPHGGCYAEAIAGRFSGPGQPFHGFAERTSKGARWTGKVALMKDRLALPMRWRKPAKIFVSSTSDVFHDALPDEAIDRIFAVMALCPQHTFQLLTKRSARMRRYMISRCALAGNIGGSAVDLALEDGRTECGGVSSTYPAKAAEVREQVINHVYGGLPNVWLGVSVEDQTRVDERIPDLLATPAAIRFISAEPLLGRVDLNDIDVGFGPTVSALHDAYGTFGSTINWVIAGGESGPGARPMHPDWMRSLRDQCVAAGVPFLFKQWGEWLPASQTDANGDICALGNPNAPPKRVGKKAAGRLLDGVEHNGYPGAANG